MSANIADLPSHDSRFCYFYGNTTGFADVSEHIISPRQQTLLTFLTCHQLCQHISQTFTDTPANCVDVPWLVSTHFCRKYRVCPFDLPGHISSLASILLTVWRTVLTCVVMSVAMLADIDDVPCHVSSHTVRPPSLALLQFDIAPQIVELSLSMREILLLSSISMSRVLKKIEVILLCSVWKETTCHYICALTDIEAHFTSIEV
ncbi:hypothetical protein LWI28_014305 [Acer negundo]|uniref:Uncharacterized protein n=1 Tax=Acer negundo TaxID=4023 RepID=A0AAD5J4S1_ACENE|nr:hypothetical protein LWI28_014305 [Acer negundo]